MSKHLIILCLLLNCQILIAQNCQEIVQSITSNSTNETIETNSNTGEVIIYYDLCIGQTLTLQAEVAFPENNTNYYQSINSTNFSWFLDENMEENEATFSYTPNGPGGHTISLEAEDVNGCSTTSIVKVYIRVSSTPTINLDIEATEICPGVVTNISTQSNSDLNFSTTIETGGWASAPCEDEFSDPLYLPDGSGAEYQTQIILACFGENQTLTDVNDILSIDINMEHSYSGDLDIYLIAPNGIEVVLFEQYGSSTWFGEATDGDATETNPGIGYDYGWSMNPSYNGTMANGMDNNNSTPQPDGGFGNILNSDTYLPVGNFNDFLGTPLNGTWTIRVVDNLTIDNGWIFSWGISMNQNIIPSSWSFDNYIVDEYFLNGPSIVSNIGNSINVLTEPGINNFTYQVVDNFGCTYNEEFSVTTSDYISITEQITDEYCGGNDGEVTLLIEGGTPEYLVEWNHGVYGASIDNLEEGVYFYDVTDDLGCEMTGNISIDNDIIGLTFDTEINDDHCNQGIGEIEISDIDGDGPYNFVWSHSNINQASAENLSQGSYIVYITDSFGCSGETIVEINNIDGPTAYFSQDLDTVSYVDGLVQFINLSASSPNAPITVSQWSFGDGGTSYSYQPSHNFTQIGSYNVQLSVFDEFGCSDSYTNEVVAVEDYYMWTASAFTPNGDEINDIYKPIFHNIIESSYKLFIYDRWGKLVYETTNINEGWDGIRVDNGMNADPSHYTYLARFVTYGNQLQEEIGTFQLIR